MNYIQNSFLEKSFENKNSYSNRQFYKNIYKAGIYFGYPKCCINSYISHHYNEKSFTYIQVCVSSGTGFIPCLRHAEYLHNRNIDIDTIIGKRECPLSFPNHEE